MTINDIFDNKLPNTHNSKPRKYDIKVSLISGGKDNRIVIRFGFLNKANDAFRGEKFIQISNVEKFPERIYFRQFDEKKYVDCHKLGSKSPTALEAKLTPTNTQLGIYKDRFIGTHNLKFDYGVQLYYIEALNR